MTTDLMTTREAAEYLCVPEATLRWWRHVGEGPASFTLGRRTVKYKKSDLDAWVEESYANSSTRRP